MNIIQFGKVGDTLNILPALLEGGNIVLEPPYDTICDGTSYAGAVSRLWNLDAAVTEFPTYKVTNLNGTPRRNKNFCYDSWNRTGLSESERDARPLVFDRRDASREKTVLGALGALARGRVLVNISGDSFQFPARRLFDSKLKDDYIRINDVRTPRVYDMLYLFERARLLITVDTGLVHLAYACGLPLIVIGPDDPYLFAAPRAHWVKTFTESEALLHSTIEYLNSF